MLTYTLDFTRKRTLTKQLYENIKRDVLFGELKSGEKLPSKRSLSEHLKISVITVENAYSQLVAEGYICSRPRSGYYVSALDVMPISFAQKEALSTYSELQKVEREPFVVDLKTNRICSDNCPCTTLSRIMRQVLTEREGLLQPLEFCGVRELREAISEQLYRFREIAVSPDQIIIGAGTEYLYHLLIQLLGRNKCYALETPGYNKIARIYERNDVRYFYVPVDKSGMSAKELGKTDAQIVHISPSHHFPTGVVMPIKRRQEILNWVREDENRYIIEDDYDSEFRFNGHPIPPLFSLDKDKVVYINTFSKSITPAVRISYMILPEVLMERYRKDLGFYSCSVSGIDQYMLARFIREGYFERHINRMKTMYRAKRDTIIEAIRKSSFSHKVEILEEHAGLHFLMKIKTNIGDNEMRRLAQREGIKVAFLTEYMQDITQDDEHIMVINYSGLEEETLFLMVERLEKILS